MKRLLCFILLCTGVVLGQSKPSSVLSQGAQQGQAVQYCGFTGGVPIICPAGNTPQTFVDLQTSSRPFADVRTCGAVCDGVHDDTAAINSCITKMHRSTLNCGLSSTPPTANCTGVVYFPNLFCYASQVVMQNNVSLKGTGWNNSGIVQLSNSNENLITGTNPATDQRFSIEDLFINGNSANQTGTGDCVHFDSTGTLEDSTRSPRHTIINTFVANCKQDAISLQGEAGSNNIINSYGMNSGRYGANVNTYDSHIVGGEFGSNAVAGGFIGPHGSGSVIGAKFWGNGTTTTGDGLIVTGGNERVNGNEANDNFCNGFHFIGVRDFTLDGFIANGNGQTGGGLGCAATIFDGSSFGHVSGTVVGVVDAGQSDYAIGFLNNSLNLLIDMVVDNVKVGFWSGSSGTNTMRFNNQNITSESQIFNAGLLISGFSDNTTTKQYTINAANGQFNKKADATSVSGWTIFNVGGPNNWDFINENYLTLQYTAGKYQLQEGSAGTGGATGQPFLWQGFPIQFGTGTNVNVNNCLKTTNASGVAQLMDSGYDCTQPRGAFSGSSGTTFTGVNTNYGGTYTPTTAITITGFDIHLDSAGTCTVYPVIGVFDETANAVVAGTQITLSATPKVNFHATASANVPAGDVLAFATTTPGTCTTNPTSPHFNVEFVQQ